MAFSDTILDLAPYIDAGFMIISLIICLVFVSRLDKTVSKMSPNILGLILMTLGLSFHILGHLIRPQIIDTQIYEDGIDHLLAAYISASVAMFVIGSILIAYHITSEENKDKIKIFLYVYGLLGLFNIVFHLSFLIVDETWTNDIFGTNPSRVNFYFILFEAFSLIVIYVLILLQSQRSVRKAVAERFRLLSITSLGFVIVIFVDSFLSLGFFETSPFSLYFVLFWLHVITVGTLYLLVFFPLKYQHFRGIGLTTV